jgi:hypothetical protein
MKNVLAVLLGIWFVISCRSMSAPMISKMPM